MALIYMNDPQRVWDGSRIDGIAHPTDIETKWTVAELEAVGLQAQPIPEQPAQPAPIPETLEQAKVRFTSAVDDYAEERRLQYITAGVGQALTYIEKREEAKQVVAGGKPTADALSLAQAVDQYPILAASIGVEAPSLWECAHLVITTARQWAAISNSIETGRLTAKRDINQASDIEGVKAVYNSLTQGVA